jgi:diguanylate cyclase (GGDEF)-like protein
VTLPLPSTPPRERPTRIISLLVLVSSAVAPGLIAMVEGAPVWALSGVLPLLAALVVLAHDHDRRVEYAARRLLTAERQQERMAESVRHVGRAFGSGLDLPALADVMADTEVDALDASRTLVRVAGHDASAGLPDPSLDALLEDVAESAVGGRKTTFAGSGSGEHAMAHPLHDGSGVLAVARGSGPFTTEERALLAWLAAQAEVSVENVALHERLLEQVNVDGLTGLGNRRVFQETLTRELALARRTGAPLGLIVLDLDDFKAVNDTHGHPAGDAVLAAVGRALRTAMRTTDTVVRWGGEEFAVILPHTDVGGAAAAATSAHAAIRRVRVPLPDGSALRVTASLGVASAPRCSRDPEGLYAAADEALYEAKQQGKDRVCTAGTAATVAR